MTFAFSPHSVLTCSLWFPQQAAIISLNSINRLFVAMETGVFPVRYELKLFMLSDAESVPKFHFSLHASHATRPTLTSKYPIGSKGLALLMFYIHDKAHFPTPYLPANPSSPAGRVGAVWTFKDGICSVVPPLVKCVTHYSSTFWSLSLSFQAAACFPRPPPTFGLIRIISLALEAPRLPPYVVRLAIIREIKKLTNSVYRSLQTLPSYPSFPSTVRIGPSGLFAIRINVEVWIL
jgi:hypothetical protein